MQRNCRMASIFDMRSITAAILLPLACLLAQQQAMAEPTKKPPLVKGREFSKVRPELLRQGWKPDPTHEDMNDNTSMGYYSEAHFLYEAGYVEVGLCTQGASYCEFYYRRGKQCLRVVTQGEYEVFDGKQYPVIYNWTNECREE